MGCLELRHGLPLGGEPGREGPLVPPAHDDAAAIARELVGEVLRVADADDLCARLTPEAPRRKRHRRQERFQVTRRNIDDQPPGPALEHRSQLCRDDLDVPVHCELCQRVDLAKTALREGGEIQSQLGVLLTLRQRRRGYRSGQRHRNSALRNPSFPRTSTVVRGKIE
jgi:hypothetical protein